MSDLVKRLRTESDGFWSIVDDAADRIEQLERELSAEKALADQVYEALYFDRATDRQLAIRAYRNARGL